MLNWIRIRNLALIEATDVEFGAGFNVITGETGAGKSVLLSTVALLLGARADKGLIRSGTTRCEIAAEIKLRTTEEIAGALDNASIIFDPEEKLIQLRRVITKSQTRNFINDTPVTLNTLKTIGSFLVDIHGANEHQSLLSRSRQLLILDRYAEIGPLLKKCVGFYAELRDLTQTRDDVLGKLPSPVEVEHLRMIVDEISKVAPEIGEDDSLNRRHTLAANARTIIEITTQSAAMLNDSESAVAEQLSAVYRKLQELPEPPEELLERCARLNEDVAELASDLDSYGSNIELNDADFMELEERMSAVQRLKRRYGPGIGNVLEALADAEQRIDAFNNAEKLREQFDHDERCLHEKLLKQARKLSKERQLAAKQLSQAAIERLNKLGFPQCGFEIAFSEIEPGLRGMDQIEIMFSANRGEALQPLRNVASSGEISRVMLALKTVIADADAVPVLIFDEIDVNIGGKTAVVVGDELKKLATAHQVLAISHLPQVAAKADCHFMVDKKVVDERTFSHIKLLNNQERQAELARMLGGSVAAGQHAAELLQND
ncbi:MAG: DNA repair protein RecN [Victivallaceae bacterium]|nr:DNA repair protein RecN [Victivallaceae bacterium]